MVKVSQLTDKQLVEQIEKYEKIVRGLHRERERRVADSTPAESLMTEREKNLLQQQDHDETQTNSFTVEITDADLKQAAEVDDKVTEAHEDQEDLMRVTRLLQLSQSDLEALNQDKHRKQAEEKAQVLKERRKRKK